MKYYKELESQKKRNKYLRWNEKRIETSEEALKQNTKQILCQRMHNCRNKETQRCFYCSRNKARSITIQAKDYYIPKIEGLKYL